jgi:ribosomal protein L3 glutamine methyltransferase
LNDLHSVRDWLRYGVSRFNAAGLVYGHGTVSAVDEAAFLILSALDLPVDELDPWLNCRLTRPEREQIAGLIEKRIATRKPAPYLVKAAYIGDKRFYVDERVIVPRSYIGELLGGGLTSIVSNPRTVARVLDLCTGSGALAILAAEAFPNAMIDAADISADALDVAMHNVTDYGLGRRIRLIRSDLFSALGEERYDLILSNPPYVSAEAMAAFPPEHRAEPAIAHDGGEDGLDIVRRILAEAEGRLMPLGTLVVEIGTGREKLEAEHPSLPFLWLDTEESEGEVFALSHSAISRPSRKAKSAAKQEQA